MDNNYYACSPVPMKSRRSTFLQVLVWVGFGYVVTGLFVGGVLSGFGNQPGMSFSDAVISVAIGASFLTLLTSLLGIIAQRSGFGLGILSRYSYGALGANIPLAIMGLLTLGWFSLIVGMTGSIWGDVFNTGIVFFDPSVINLPGPEISIEVFFASLLFGLLFTFTAFFGIKGLEMIALPISPIILIIAIVVGYLVIKEGGGWESVLDISNQKQGLSISAGITTVIGAWIAGAVMGVELFRFNKNILAVFLGSFACFILTNPLLNFVGYFGAIGVGQFNYVSWMMGFSVLFAIFGAIIWTASLWTTNDAELYCNAQYMAPMFKSFGKTVNDTHIVIAAGLAGTLIGSFGFYQIFFADFINILGAVAPPLCGPIIAQYYFIDKQKMNIEKRDSQPKYRLEGILSFISGALVGIVFQYYIPIAFPAAVLGLLASVLSYPLYAVLLRKKQGEEYA